MARYQSQTPVSHSDVYLLRSQVDSVVSMADGCAYCYTGVVEEGQIYY